MRNGMAGSILRILPVAIVGLMLAPIGAARAATYMVTSVDDSGAGSLRQALIDSNNTLPADTIMFAIPGTGPHIIRPMSALPDITSTVLIDGYTQTGASPNTLTSGNNAVLMIELDGRDAGVDVAGLDIKASFSTIKGLAIIGFRGSGIHIDSGQIGNTIQGNFLGRAVSGATLIGNRGHGVDMDGNNCLVGGSCVGCGNIIAGNLEDGVLVIDNGIGNTVWHNSIFANGPNDRTALGIDLYVPGASGANANDECDPDGGSNFLQNFPDLTSAESDGTNTTIIGTLNSTPSTTFVLEFFANTACDRSGHGEGETFLGTTNVTTGAGCFTTFSSTLPIALADGTIITATATDPTGNTSEFSKCFNLTGPQPHDLAVVLLTAPRRVTLTERVPAPTKTVKVTIQNRSRHNEVIPSAMVLGDLVSLSVQSLPSGKCGNLTGVLVAPETFPITVLPKRRLTLTYNVAYNCANDRLPSSRTTAHDDYKIVAIVDHTALDNEADTHPVDDACPHGPLPGGFDPYPDGTIRDKGCGRRDRTTHLLGADVLVDVVMR